MSACATKKETLEEGLSSLIISNLSENLDKADGGFRWLPASNETHEKK